MHLKGWVFVGCVLFDGDVAPRGIGLPTLGKCLWALWELHQTKRLMNICLINGVKEIYVLQLWKRTWLERYIFMRMKCGWYWGLGLEAWSSAFFCNRLEIQRLRQWDKVYVTNIHLSSKSDGRRGKWNGNPRQMKDMGLNLCRQPGVRILGPTQVGRSSITLH